MDSRKFLYDNNELFQSISLPSQDLPAPALYVVGLPIGNLGDITLRALLVLSKADCIAAEDTRETRKLLEKFNIESHLFPVHQHNEHKGARKGFNLFGRRPSGLRSSRTPERLRFPTPEQKSSPKSEDKVIASFRSPAPALQ